MLYLTSLISICLLGLPSGPWEASRDLNLKKQQQISQKVVKMTDVSKVVMNVFLPSVNLSALTCQKLWSEGLCGRKTVSPPPQMSHLTSPCCSGNEGLQEKHISSLQLHSQDSFLETRRPEVWTLVHHYNITCSGSLTSESFSKVSRARKCFHETDIW